MKEAFMFGLEMMGIGFFIVFIALFALALILMLFNKIFAGVDGKHGKGGQAGKGVPVKSDLVRAKQELAPALSLPGEKPEIVAAAMGALLFTMEEGVGRRFAITRVTGTGEIQNNWAQIGRSRLLQLRQDFVLSKRGKSR